MATTYQIKTLSGDLSKKAQITLIHNGRSVTRHLNRGYGRHPDDSIPSLHRKLEERLKDLFKAKTLLVEEVQKGEKVLLDAAAPLNDKALVAKRLPALRARILSLPGEVRQAEYNLKGLRQSDPLMVRFTLDKVGE